MFCREHAQEQGKQHLKGSIASPKHARCMLAGSIASLFEAIMLQVALELGGYIGYSAVRIASQLPPGGKLYSIDPNESHVRIARALIQHAGLSDKVEVIQGILETSIQVHAWSDIKAAAPLMQECFMRQLWFPLLAAHKQMCT